MKHSIPLLEFDPAREAIIEPAKVITLRDVPERCVFCFFREAIDDVAKKIGLTPLRPLKSDMGPLPVYSAVFNGHSIGIVPAMVGAPLAAIIFEAIIARGGRKFIVCGGAGVLDSSIASGDVVVPTSAVRDEGTSYHYLPPDREAHPSPQAVEAITRVLDRRGCRYVKGKTWTTDGFYRETPDRVTRRRAEGCLTVEMEAAALFAVAEFRGIQVGLILHGGDDVSGFEWDRREFGRKIPARDILFRLSLEACTEM
ncbi:MAG TPA: nucleoside phosphorylase [Syntrophales bacterium]|nr:nucleoside phosphorylase [Syntrophales bacterium]HPQ43772.1 nucleoside phosphorylase [Syntrophales bacterium]